DKAKIGARDNAASDRGLDGLVRVETSGVAHRDFDSRCGHREFAMSGREVVEGNTGNVVGGLVVTGRDEVGCLDVMTSGANVVISGMGVLEGNVVVVGDVSGVEVG
ncbi:hypothetical protein KI387_041906, partial [Taxus chinensis]